MNEKHDVDAAEAARSLEAIGDTHRRVAGRVGSPPHYYTKLGAGMGLICLAQPLDTVAKTGLVLVAAAVLGWAVGSYSKATGTWTMATLREPGAWMAWLMIGVMIGALAFATFVQTWAVCVPAAAASLVVTWWFGPRWDAAWVRSLQEEA